MFPLDGLRCCGHTIRYNPAATRVTKDSWNTYLLRGKPSPDVNQYSEPPVFDRSPRFDRDFLADETPNGD